MLTAGVADTADLLITFRGLPAHPLVVHAAVVFGPLACLAAVVYVLVPPWRDYLRWPTLVLALLALGSIWAAYLTGDNFKSSEPYFSQGALGTAVAKHEELADTLRWLTTGFAVLAVAVTAWLHRRTWMHRRTAILRNLCLVLLVCSAVVTAVWIFRTGEAGAKSVYPPEQYLVGVLGG